MEIEALKSQLNLYEASTSECLAKDNEAKTQVAEDETRKNNISKESDVKERQSKEAKITITDQINFPKLSFFFGRRH